MTETAVTLFKNHLSQQKIPQFAHALLEWLMADEAEGVFTESRGRALLRTMAVVDAPTLADFDQLMARETAVRLLLYDVLTQSGLSNEPAVQAMAEMPTRLHTELPPPWIVLVLAAFAHKAAYPLSSLDPALPPEPYTPAGQVCQQSAHLIRQQVQRSATERDKLVRRLAYVGGEDTAVSGQPIPPLPPVFRPPIPVRYPEYARETVQISPEDTTHAEETAVSVDPPLTITPDDLSQESPAPASAAPARMPAITIQPDDVNPRALSRQRPQTAASASTFGQAVKKFFDRRNEPFKTTKLRVVVQTYPDGPGMYGLQIHVRCKGIRSYAAGTTNRDGHFVCELPVRLHAGLTYDVDVIWPDEFQRGQERKSITLNADRTEFTLPFYLRYSQRGD
ncbi:MAG: hypothetical protein Kow0080_35300 [Candidatus Promineifilaceae bacterium]